ncbi:MAG: Rnase Y domain-containing protein, partial [Planctomycetota bacterium]|nr:Rnase Y domain-containing protein [Planctomycetota bacterium]
MNLIGQIEPLSITIGVIGGLFLGALIVYLVQQFVSTTKTKGKEQELAARLESARREAENITKTARLEAASELIKRKEEFTEEITATQNQLREQERRLSKREDTFDRQMEQLSQRDKQLKEMEHEQQRRKQSYDAKNAQLSTLIAEQKNQLLKITGMNIEEAKVLLLSRLEGECEREMNSLIERKAAEAEETAEQKGREIISSAIQRYAAEQTCEVSVSMVDIPNDEMKGRVIGREGRNIRAFEKATGVDVIVDDTPGVIIVSGFNPTRREIARLSMERLIQDGRIHPSRIEELVAQTKKDVHDKILQLGKAASVEVDVRGLNNKILVMLGSLNYRTSYGQNVLRHSVEVAFLAQVMADELGLDGSIAKRAGFLHDIGKA